ncbi:glucan biosynthesis protein [Chthonobacter albigriseus]|uniref:glucan biosynthesis protein n=1 Tax=Chthonobacter albigriseus TaxID=1683161 RepID=UPI0015EEDBB2|nr:glucan biosynthesis protein D [Chthonobacter albigriseus]
MTSLSRRDVLGALAALGLAPALPLSARAEEATILGKGRPFSFDGLIAEAKARADKPFAPKPVVAAEVLERIDYEEHWQIKFKADHTVQIGGGKAPIRFFHLGKFFKEPVGIYVVDGDQAAPVLYSPDFFDVPAGNPAEGLPADIGFAGFRVMEPGVERDWLAFLGAAYFRSSGAMDQYGLSARAIAIDTALPTPEEFPRFTDFFFAPSEKGTLVIYAALEGPSVSGAVRWDCARGTEPGDKGVVMDMACRFFARKDIQRLGVGALTSMFWYNETNRLAAPDWRPEIHDSDGLAIATGAGERLWRPLNNPPRVMTSTFVDRDPKGFGLMQRDRSFENYQDDGVFYEKRSSVWVEPKNGWGEGAVQLVEIPTVDEIHDNIVAYWVPAKPVKKGDLVAVDYRLTWLADEPNPPAIGRVISTRLGIGGVPGQPRPKDTVKYVVDFEGGKLGDYGQGQGVEAVVSAASGTISGTYVLPVVGTKRWRAVFDFKPTGNEPVDMRLFLKVENEALTETWLFQHHPGTFVPPAHSG